MAFMKFMNIALRLDRVGLFSDKSRVLSYASTNKLRVMSPGFCSLSFLFLLWWSNDHTLILKMAAKRESLDWSMASWEMEFNHALTSLCYKTIINLVTRKLNSELNLNLKWPTTGARTTGKCSFVVV